MPSSKPKVKWGIECPECGERLFSWHVHDFHYCKGQHVFIDGGNEYLRFSHSADGRIPKRIKWDSKLDEQPIRSNNVKVHTKPRKVSK